jgi:hypothetical protein
VLEARAALLAAACKRTWEIPPDLPVLIVIIDEYAELVDEAPVRWPIPIPSPGLARSRSP